VREAAFRSKVASVLRESAAVVRSCGDVRALVDCPRPGIRDQETKSRGEPALQPRLQRIEICIADRRNESARNAPPTQIRTPAVHRADRSGKRLIDVPTRRKFVRLIADIADFEQKIPG